jgi:CspA family cold shock protein
MRFSHPPVVGTVEIWHREGGWGVLRIPDDLTVFCHFSDVEAEGFVELRAGESVWFDYETPGQDGCDARVLSAARPGTADSDVPLGRLAPRISEIPRSSTQQTVTITYPDGRTETFEGA